VFVSFRSGYAEIWVCGSDGSNPVQLTFLRAPMTASPHWSPDGKRIVFDSNAGGNWEVYGMDAGGGRPRNLTNHPAVDGVPSFSHDGRWIYFTSERTGRKEMWKMPAEGRNAVQLTRNGGYFGVESPDGKYLYYATTHRSTSLWRLPMHGGEEQKIAEPVMGSTLAVAARGLYFARPPQPDGGNSIEFLNFSTGKTTAIAATQRPIFWSVSVSPDERYLLWGQNDQEGSDLMLVENFR
jgi:Tol biopolymer transport system component